MAWPQPKTTPRVLQGFLGLAGYYRKFIKAYGAIVAPLTRFLVVPSGTTSIRNSQDNADDGINFVAFGFYNTVHYGV